MKKQNLLLLKFSIDKIFVWNHLPPSHQKKQHEEGWDFYNDPSYSFHSLRIAPKGKCVWVVFFKYCPINMLTTLWVVKAILVVCTKAFWLQNVPG